MGRQVEQTETREGDRHTGQPGEGTAGGKASELTQQERRSLQQAGLLEAAHLRPSGVRGGNGHGVAEMDCANGEGDLRPPCAAFFARGQGAVVASVTKPKSFAIVLIRSALRSRAIEVHRSTQFDRNKSRRNQHFVRHEQQQLPIMNLKDKTLDESPPGPGSSEVAPPQGEATLLPTKRTRLPGRPSTHPSRPESHVPTPVPRRQLRQQPP